MRWLILLFCSKIWHFNWWKEKFERNMEGYYEDMRLCFIVTMSSWIDCYCFLWKLSLTQINLLTLRIRNSEYKSDVLLPNYCYISSPERLSKQHEQINAIVSFLVCSWYDKSIADCQYFSVATYTCWIRCFAGVTAIGYTISLLISAGCFYDEAADELICDAGALSSLV